MNSLSFIITLVLSHISNNNPNKRIKTFDFKTLYTKIPHNKLKEAMELFVRDVFGYNKNKDIDVRNKSANMVNKRGDGLSFSIVELINAINTVIEHSYIKFNSKVYKQIIGTYGNELYPMLANIFLHIYEKEFISYILTVNTNITYSMKHIFRFQDELIVFEGDDVFTTVSGNIYPAEMVLKNSNISPNDVNDLDLNITFCAISGKYVYKLYDKRDDFNLKIMNYPNLSGKKPCYGAVISQLVRYANINLHIDSFKLDVMVMVDKLIRRSWVKYLYILEKCIHIYGLNLDIIYLIETLLNTFFRVFTTDLRYVTIWLVTYFAGYFVIVITL